MTLLERVKKVKETNYPKDDAFTTVQVYVDALMKDRNRLKDFMLTIPPIELFDAMEEIAEKYDL